MEGCDGAITNSIIIGECRESLIVGLDGERAFEIVEESEKEIEVALERGVEYNSMDATVNPQVH